MLKIFVEEAAALASLTLFVGMIAVWAQLFTQLWRRAPVGEKREGLPRFRVSRGLGRNEPSPSRSAPLGESPAGTGRV